MLQRGEFNDDISRPTGESKAAPEKATNLKHLIDDSHEICDLHNAVGGPGDEDLG